MEFLFWMRHFIWTNRHPASLARTGHSQSIVCPDRLSSRTLGFTAGVFRSRGRVCSARSWVSLGPRAPVLHLSCYTFQVPFDLDAFYPLSHLPPRSSMQLVPSHATGGTFPIPTRNGAAC